MKLTKKRELNPNDSGDALNGVLGKAIDRRTFLRRAGLAIGGGAVAAALKLSSRVENAVIVSIICDRGDRYLSTALFRSVCAKCPP